MESETFTERSKGFHDEPLHKLFSTSSNRDPDPIEIYREKKSAKKDNDLIARIYYTKKIEEV
jgi:hypothetical protein